MDDTLRKLAHSVTVIRHLQRGGNVDRTKMSHKDVTKRVPELTEGAQKLASGEISKLDYDALVNRHKPITPYESVPRPATYEEMHAALKENQKPLLGKTEDIPEGTPVGNRLDIPAYVNHQTWIPTTHEQEAGFKAGKVLGHNSVSHVTDAVFGVHEPAAVNFSQGNTNKGTWAVIKGNHVKTTPEEARALAVEAMHHPEWVQVGMDPERHSYFYDRHTTQPIVSAARVLQVGPLVLAHKPVYGKKEDFAFKDGGDVEAYADPKSKHIQDWNWRPLEDVQSQLGLTEIPSHVHEFGKFMDRTAEKASKEGLTPRDLIKAYTITRASIQRKAAFAEKLRKAGMILPDDVGEMVRPEGAFGHWLHSPAGQAYLDAAQNGQIHERAIADAVQRMAPFGRHETDIPDSLRWAAKNLPDKAAAVSHLVAAGRENASTPQEWRDFVTNIRGIGPSKAGFVASLMGRGDQPTLDARQIILHTGKPSKEAAPHIARKGGAGGNEAVERLAARQTAMNLKTPKGMEPYYQHLTHHAVWDKAGNEETTHQDVIDAMQHAARGGTIMDHPLAIVMHGLHPEGYGKGGKIGHNQGPALEDNPRFRELMSKILDPRNPEHFEAAKKIAENYGVNDLSYSKFKKQPILPSQVTTQISDIAGATPVPENRMSWHDFYRIGKGGVLFTLGGDRSNLGRLTHINGVKLGWPVDLHAGTKYQREPNAGAGWANDKSAQSTLLNNIRKANDKGMEAFGAFAPMQTTAIDSSKNMTDAYMSHLAAHTPHQDVIDEINNLIRTGQHVYNSTPGKPAKKEAARQKKLETMQQFPGLEDPWAARNFAFENMSGQDRSGMIKLLDKAEYLKYGMPSVGVTRAAITDPDLLHTSNNMVGGNIVRLSADKYDPKNLSFVHSTYKYPTSAKYEATVPFMPRHDVLPDFIQGQLINPEYVNKSGPNKGDPLLVHPMSPNPMGRASIRGNTEMRQAWQPINDRMLESIEQGQERIKKFGFEEGGSVRRAYKKSGQVEGGVWHEKDAPEPFMPHQIHGTNIVTAEAGEPIFSGRK